MVRTSELRTVCRRMALIVGIFGALSFTLPVASQANAKAIGSCRSFTSGRTTCSYDNGSGGVLMLPYRAKPGYSIQKPLRPEGTATDNVVNSRKVI
jgi:hypothetical protein